MIRLITDHRIQELEEYIYNIDDMGGGGGRPFFFFQPNGGN